MIAVLEEAMSLLFLQAGNSSNGRNVAAREAERWIAADDRSGPFAFSSICDVLGLEPSRVREAVAALRDRQRSYRRRRIQSGMGRHRVRSSARASRRAA